MTPPRCAKCKGLLVYVVETLEIGAKLDVIKCINCGNRTERPHLVPVGAVGKLVPQPEVFKTKTTYAPLSKPTKSTKYKNEKVCTKCNRLDVHSGRGLCGKCYQSEKKAGRLDKWSLRKRKKPAMATVATVTLDHVPATMTLAFRSATDQALLRRLEASAQAARRDLDQQAMALLEAALQ